MIQIYPTLIDSYQYFLNSEMSLQDMIDRVNRVERPINEAALRGSALNDLIDTLLWGGKFPIHTVKDVQNYRFEFMGKEYHFPISIINDLLSRLSDSLPQIKVEREIKTSFGDVLIYGYTDYINQNKITDLKTTARYAFPKYLKNFQHKAYLYCLEPQGINEFEYLVTDFNGIYVEKYDWNSYMMDSLLADLNGFLQFINEHKGLITDKKILGI